MTLEEHVPLARQTTFGLGGEARYYVAVTSVGDVHEALAFARERSLPLFVLGGGSNIVVADDGFPGLVLAMRITGVSATPAGEVDHVTAGAGVVWDDFVQHAIGAGYAGLECLSGVPGTVGGAVVANVGCYGAQVSDTFLRAEVLDTSDLARGVMTLEKSACNFAYHESVFDRTHGRYIVLSATFALPCNNAATPAYRDNRFDLSKLAARLGHAPSTLEIRAAVLDMREAKGALVMPGRKGFKCAGSFFHLVFVSPEHYRAIEARARELDAAKEERLRPWAWPQADGRTKVASGFLLEYTPFVKGYTRDGVGISPQHTLSIINAGEGSASAVAALARDMQAAVEREFGVVLEREVEYVGDIARS